MNKEQALLQYVSRLGDNALILGQRMVELVAAYPELEEELAQVVGGLARAAAQGPLELQGLEAALAQLGPQAV